MQKIMAVEADSRGRVLLGKDAAGTTYRMSQSPDGTILLEPARLYTESEIAVLANPRIAEGLTAAKDGTFTGDPLQDHPNPDQCRDPSCDC